jgi:hypothetical protein
MQTYILGLALLGGLGVFGTFYGLTAPPLRLRRAQTDALEAGLQVRLQRAGLGIAPAQFLLRGGLIGAGMAVAAYIASGSIAAGIPFLIGGYAALWAHLEDQRNRDLTRYHRNLATAMNLIVNAWRIIPTLSGALEAVVRYGPGSGDSPEDEPEENSVAADFNQILRALRTGASLRSALQPVADRRQSPIVDGLAIALLTAEEQGATAGDMLERQAQLTRQQVQAFDRALNRQRTARSEVRNGTLGPWAILLFVRLTSSLTLMGGPMPADTMIPDSRMFFATPIGNLVGFVAGAITIGMYTLSMRIAARGLRLERVPTEHGREEAKA